MAEQEEKRSVRLTDVRLVALHFHEVPPEELPNETGTEAISDDVGSRSPPVRFVFGDSESESNKFQKYIGVETTPDPANPYRLQVGVVGSFEVLEEAGDVSLQRFRRYHAPAILFPYLRETVANITDRTMFNAIHLPPANLFALVDSAELLEDSEADNSDEDTD